VMPCIVQAYAFGGNEYAQATGEESHADADTLDVVTPQPCLSHLKVSQVAAGGMHSVALTDTGEV
jgi:alpha-tubulin suppressor-like RCC1 family protein